MLKSEVGIPPVEFAGRRIDLGAEARKARRRLLPVTFFYTGYALTVFALALRSGRGALVPSAYLVAGVAAWTPLEYVAHRFVLHGRFPAGPGLLRRWTHHAFDHLHAQHHARPWDGNHINGSVKDTGAYMAFFAALSFTAPLTTLPVLWAAVMQSYVVEEWIHHCVHYHRVYGLKNAYWRSISRHHAFHHSRLGSDMAFGLTSGSWDIVFGTRVPARERALLCGSSRHLNARPRAPSTSGRSNATHGLSVSNTPA